MWLAFFTSPNWFRLLMGTALMIYALRIPLKPPCYFGIIALPIILLLRDFVTFWLPERTWIILCEFLMAGMYMCVFDSYRNNRTGRIFLLSSLPVMGLFTFLVHRRPEVLFLYVIQILILVAAFAIMVSQMNAISPKNVRHGILLGKTREFFSRVYVVVLILEIVLPVESFFYQSMLLPGTFLLHSMVMYVYYRQYKIQFEKRLHFARSYINSVFDFIRKVNEALSEHIAVKQVMDFVIASVMDNTHADGGVIYLYDSREQVLKVSSISGRYPPPYPLPDIVKQKVGKVEVYIKSKPISPGETLIGKSAETRSPVFISHTARNPETSRLIQDEFNYCSSLIVLPLLASGKLMGVMSIVSIDKDHHFTQEDFERCQVFGDYTALTIEALYNYMELLEKREMEREVEIAGGIQRNLFPRELPQNAFIDISAQTIPARGVSGDYYDIIQMPGNPRIGCLVCDVAGKGIPASLVMVMIRTIVHLIADKELNARDFVTFINRGVAGNVGIERFATLAFLLINPESGEAQYCNAAHHPLLVFRKASGDFEQIDSEGVPVGIDSEWEYPQTNFNLMQDDVMILYTDGITEAMDMGDRQFGLSRLKEVIQKYADLPPEEIKDRVFEAIDRFVGTASQHDDETLIVMRKMKNNVK